MAASLERERRDRQPNLQRKHEIELAKLKANNELLRDVVRYVGEDLRSQLLLVALTGTSIAVIIDAYKVYLVKHEADEDAAEAAAPPEKPHLRAPSVPLWIWVLTGGLGGVQYAMADFVSKNFDQSKFNGSASSPWAFISSMQAAATTTSGLAWAALFASIILGEGGLGGILDKAGGGGFGQIASTLALA